MTEFLEDENKMTQDELLEWVRRGSPRTPVNPELLDAPGFDPGTVPYAVPDPVAMAELSAAIEMERQVADQVATVRDEQSQKIANMGLDGAPHFLINKDGQELCGSCGAPFPCGTWIEDVQARNLADSSGQPVPEEDRVRAVMELLQVSEERARQILLLSTPLDEIK